MRRGLATECVIVRANAGIAVFGRGKGRRVAVERNSIPDLVACFGQGRAQYEAGLLRIMAYPSRCVEVEGIWSTLESRDYRPQVAPAAVCGSIAAGTGRYRMPFTMLGDRDGAERFTWNFLFHAAR